MNSKEMEYVNSEQILEKTIRAEIILTPLLVFLPLFIGCFLIYDWYNRDFLLQELDLFGELLLGFVIVFFNIIFDIPFIKNIINAVKK